MNNKPPLNLSLPAGTVVLYEQDGEALLALIQGQKKDKYILLNERGRPLELAGNRLNAFKLNAASNLSTNDQQKFLSDLKTKSIEISKAIDLAEIWQVVQEDQKTYQSDDLAELSFGSSSPEQKLAMKLKLILDRAYFKRDRETFIARTPEIVEQLKKAQAVLEEKAQLRLQLIDYFKNPAKFSDPLPAHISGLIDLLKRYAVSAELNPQEEKEAKEITELALECLNKDSSRPAPYAAYAVLEHVKLFGRRTNPAWVRSSIPGKFEIQDTDVFKSSIQEDRFEREDFTDLHTFTIDDVSTRDMDDAISLERLSSGYRVGIHISDVASFIPVQSSLDRAVMKRLSSVYLPERTIHMLPESLALEHFSLIKGQRRAVLSLMVDFDHSYNVLNCLIKPSWIEIKHRYSYDEVDLLLENGDRDFGVLYELASHLESERMEAGAMHVNKTEIIVSVNSDGLVSLRQIDEHSPARALVAEMAVLMNKAVAEYCRDNGVGVIYRGQPEPDDEYEDEKKPEAGRALDHFIRVRLKRSEASLNAISHAGLGLKAYLQVTSPIRRYVDLINQRQLLAKLTSREPIYSKDELENLLQETEDGVFQINKLSKESKRFWLLRYLEQKIAKNNVPNARKIDGVVVKTIGKNPLVELDEVFFAAYVKSNRKLTVGENVHVIISAVDAKADYLKLEVV